MKKRAIYNSLNCNRFRQPLWKFLRKAAARRSGGSFELVDLLSLLADCQGNRKRVGFRGSRARLSRAGGRSGGHSGGD